jgi:hypothetical protein
MSSALQKRKLKKRIINVSLVDLFCERFECIIHSKTQPTLLEMLEIYKWMHNQAVDTIDPHEIKYLIRCRRIAYQAFSKFNCLPSQIAKESQNLGQYLNNRYEHLTHTIDWEIGAGRFKIRRKVNLVN